MRWPGLIWAAGLLALLHAGCGWQRYAARASAAPGSAPSSDVVRFTDITGQAGIRFQHFSGARGKLYFPESGSPGCAFFDYNNDGRPDILITNGMDWPGAARGPQPTMALYRNNGDGTFTDVTRQAGLDIPMHGMGVAAADYDNDGWQDLYITAALGPSRLFHNDRGRFKDVTSTAGAGNSGRWGTSAAWFDYDGDGLLDLYVANYCRWTPSTDVYCSAHGGKKTYCIPTSYDGQPGRLYHNDGNGRFSDATDRAGLRFAPGKTWGVALGDASTNGRPDLILANDLEPTALFRGKAPSPYAEVGTTAGIALSESGLPKAGMGVDAADVDNSGREAVLISNFSGEGVSLFQSTADGTFQDRSVSAGLYEPSVRLMGWGAFFFDYDLDGYKDALVCDGHLYPDVQQYQPSVTYAEPALLFHNLGDGRFREVAQKSGDLSQPMVARGASYADIDGDGDLDVLIAANGGHPRLLRNDGGNRNNWLRVRLVGRRSNRDGIGARVDVTSGGLHQTYLCRSGSSFMSTLERTITVGLGRFTAADRLEVRWPSGRIDRYGPVRARQSISLTEGEGSR